MTTLSKILRTAAAFVYKFIHHFGIWVKQHMIPLHMYQKTYLSISVVPYKWLSDANTMSFFQIIKKKKKDANTMSIINWNRMVLI